MCRYWFTILSDHLPGLVETVRFIVSLRLWDAACLSFMDMSLEGEQRLLEGLTSRFMFRLLLVRVALRTLGGGVMRLLKHSEHTL